jgi:spoIIIJ-associated protein
MFRDSIELTARTVEEATRRAFTALGVTRPEQAHVVVLDEGSSTRGWSWDARMARVRVTRRVEGFGYVARELPESLPERPAPQSRPAVALLGRAAASGRGAAAPSSVRGRPGRRGIPNPTLRFDAPDSKPVRELGIEPSKPKPRTVYERTQEDDTQVEAITTKVLGSVGLEYETRFEHGEYQRVWVRVGDRDAGMLIGRRGAGIEALEHLIEKMCVHACGHHIPLQVDVNDYRARQDDERRAHAIDLARRVLATGQETHLEPMNPRDRRVIHLAVQTLTGVTTYTIGEGNRRHIVIALMDQTQVGPADQTSRAE